MVFCFQDCSGILVPQTMGNKNSVYSKFWDPITPEMPKVMPLAHVRFQDPKTEETLILDPIGSRMSREEFVKTTETHEKLERKYSEEAINTDNAELQDPNAKADLENIKKKIRTEPGKIYHTVILESFNIKE